MNWVDGLQLALIMLGGLAGLAGLGWVGRVLVLAQRGYSKQSAALAQDDSIRRLQLALDIQERTLKEVLDRVSTLEADKIYLQSQIELLKTENRGLREELAHRDQVVAEKAVLQEQLRRLENDNATLAGKLHEAKNTITVLSGRRQLNQIRAERLETDTIEVRDGVKVPGE